MNRINFIFFSIVLAFGLIAAAGCQEKREIFINPDGSGKIVVEQVAATMEAASLEDMLSNSSGISAWTNCSTKTEAGKVTFRGTALFDDISKVKMDNSAVGLEVARKPNGNMVIRVARIRWEKDQDATQPAKKLTDEQVRKEIERIRAVVEYGKVGSEAKAMEDGVTQGTITYRLHLPGKVLAVSNMKVADDGAVEVTFDGKKAWAATNKLFADDAVMAVVARSGGCQGFSQPGPVFDGFLFKELFGLNSPVQVEYQPGGRPLFDYKAEFAGAGDDWYAKALTDLNIIPAKLQPADTAAGTVGFKSVVYEEDRMAMPDSAGHVKKVPSAKITLTAHLGQKTQGFVNLVIYRAIDINGKTLLPAPGLTRTGSDFSETPADEFSLSINLPMPAAAKLKEMSGMVSYKVDGPTSEVDLGIVEMKSGAKGNKLGFTLTEVKLVDQGQTSAYIDCKFDKPYPLQAIKFIDESGKLIRSIDCDPTQLRQEAGYDVSDPALPKVPARAKIVAVLADHAKIVQIPFHLTDIKLPEQN